MMILVINNVIGEFNYEDDPYREYPHAKKDVGWFINYHNIRPGNEDSIEGLNHLMSIANFLALFPNGYAERNIAESKYLFDTVVPYSNNGELVKVVAELTVSRTLVRLNVMLPETFSVNESPKGIGFLVTLSKADRAFSLARLIP